MLLWVNIEKICYSLKNDNIVNVFMCVAASNYYCLNKKTDIITIFVFRNVLLCIIMYNVNRIFRHIYRFLKPLKRIHLNFNI